MRRDPGAILLVEVEQTTKMLCRSQVGSWRGPDCEGCRRLHDLPVNGHAVCFHPSCLSWPRRFSVLHRGRLVDDAPHSGLRTHDLRRPRPDPGYCFLLRRILICPIRRPRRQIATSPHGRFCGELMSAIFKVTRATGVNAHPQSGSGLRYKGLRFVRRARVEGLYRATAPKAQRPCENIS